MISVEEALARVLSLSPALPSESVPLRNAAGRVLARPVAARLTQPPFPASAMDGYAIRDADHVNGASLTVIGEAGAGHAFAGVLAPGQAVRIFTGERKACSTTDTKMRNARVSMAGSCCRV